MNRYFVWGSFIAVGALTFVLTLSVRLGLVVGLGAAACVWLSLARVTARWREGLPPFINAEDPEEVGAQLRALLEQRQPR